MQNGCMMQYFEWDVPADQKHWLRLKEDAAHLADLGVTSVWIPPVYKGTSQQDVGYGVYDMYDLGEFDQKGGVATKYGTKDELIAAIEALHAHGIKVYADVVLNHRAGADRTAKFPVIEVDRNNRQQPISDQQEIEGWTEFDFPGRGSTYSDFKWHWYHFTGVDYCQASQRSSLFMIQGEGKGWADNEEVSREYGNYDYLMNADIDYRHPEVLLETKRWFKWFIEALKLDGARLDAVKHIDADFMRELVEEIRTSHPHFYLVGEYWDGTYSHLEDYLNRTDFDIDLFDVKLHQNFNAISNQASSFDLRTILDDTLAQKNPTLAVPFVDNHDSQPGQALESYVSDWFKPAAYAFILLREQGMPTLFYGDYYGLEKGGASFKKDLDLLMAARKNLAYGPQTDYFESSSCIGWTRSGDSEHPQGLAVVISTGEANSLCMNVGAEKAGQTWHDLTGHCDAVVIDDKGNGNFPVNGGSVSVWTVEG